MTPSALARPMLRQSRAWGRMATRRFESTTTAKATETAKEAATKAKDTASKAKETASEVKDSATAKASATVSEYSTKAAEGLSKVTSSAGPAIAGAAKGVANSLGKAGGRTGKLVAFIEKQTPTVLYYSKVAAETAKIVFRAQKMSPPSLSTFQAYFQNAYKTVLQNPSALLETASKATQQPANILQWARNISRAQLVTGGVVAAECLGFFTVGEIIGRFKIIGYRGGNPAAHH